MLMQLFKLLFNYDNIIDRVQRNCLNEQTYFSIMFFIAMLQVH